MTGDVELAVANLQAALTIERDRQQLYDAASAALNEARTSLSEARLEVAKAEIELKDAILGKSRAALETLPGDLS